MLPAPIFPMDGNVDEQYPNRFVFFDYNNLDIILAYRTAPDSPRSVHRIKSPPHFAPVIVSTVAKNVLAGYRYRFRVTNGPTSRQSLHKWFLSVPPPEAFSSNRQSSKKLAQREAWEQAYYGMLPGKWAVRFHSQLGGALSPNQSAGFVVDSGNRPGIVKADFHRHVSSVSSLPEDLPPEAWKQLERVKRLQGWNHKVRWTIGPKYTKRTSSREIASDFYVEVQTLVMLRLLDKNSPFVQRVLTRLDEFIERPRPWFEDEDFPREVYESLAYDEPFRPIGQPPDPRSSFEQQIDVALKLSLVRP